MRASGLSIWPGGGLSGSLRYAMPAGVEVASTIAKERPGPVSGGYGAIRAPQHVLLAPAIVDRKRLLVMATRVAFR